MDSTRGRKIVRSPTISAAVPASAPRPTRLFVVVILAALVLAACSEDSLNDLGAKSSDWIGRGASASAGPSETVIPPSVDSAEVQWFNDGLDDDVVAGSQQAVIDQVTKRSNGPERYLQATRLEIAVALPALRFPRRLPAQIVAITSQLVVAPSGDRLDSDVYAAFGLWSVEPYTKSRSVGQRGTLVVGGVQGSSACERLGLVAGALCSDETVGTLDTTRIDAESGQTWVWSDAAYEYQLFLRGSLDSNEDDVRLMTSGFVPFVEVADPTARLVGAEQAATG
jgi:hypothetical protein